MQPESPRHLTLVANLSPDQADDHRMMRRPVGTYDFPHPELAKVLSRAMSTVILALELDGQAPEELIIELEHVAATAMTEAYKPFADAASQLARSTETSRTMEATSVRRRAQETAALVSRTTTALAQRQARLAERVAEEAAAAARAAASSSVPGLKLDAKRKALREADGVRAAAASRGDRRVAAAALTAAAAGQAKVRLAIEVEHAAAIVQRDALQAADAIRVDALCIMYKIAIDAAYQHFVNA